MILTPVLLLEHAKVVHVQYVLPFDNHMVFQSLALFITPFMYKLQDPSAQKVGTNTVSSQTRSKDFNNLDGEKLHVVNLSVQ